LQDFVSGLRTLLNDAAHWVIVDPAFADVEFPQQVSQNYLTHPSRVGKNMVWLVEAPGSALEREPLSGCLISGRVNVLCYVRAKSSLESDIATARARSSAMREQVSDIVKAHRLALPGAIVMGPIGTNEWEGKEVDPMFFAKLLVVEVIYEL